MHRCVLLWANRTSGCLEGIAYASLYKVTIEKRDAECRDQQMVSSSSSLNPFQNCLQRLDNDRDRGFLSWALFLLNPKFLQILFIYLIVYLSNVINAKILHQNLRGLNLLNGKMIYESQWIMNERYNEILSICRFILLKVMRNWLLESFVNWNFFL